MAPDKASNRAHIIPYGDQATFQIGYKGLKELAERHAAVRVVFPPEAVYAKDKYTIQLGMEPKLEHIPHHEPARGEIVAFYCVADLADGAPRVFKWMWRHEVETIRDRYSKAYKRDRKESTWATDFAAMGRKTVQIQLCKQLPSTPELAEAVGLQERADLGIPQEIDILDTRDATPPGGNDKPKTLDDVVPTEPQPVGAAVEKVAKDAAVEPPGQTADDMKAFDKRRRKAVAMFEGLTHDKRAAVVGNVDGLMPLSAKETLKKTLDSALLTAVEESIRNG
jgi:recombination protein RecT